MFKQPFYKEEGSHVQTKCGTHRSPNHETHPNARIFLLQNFSSRIFGEAEKTRLDLLLRTNYCLFCPSDTLTTAVIFLHDKQTKLQRSREGLTSLRSDKCGAVTVKRYGFIKLMNVQVSSTKYAIRGGVTAKCCVRGWNVECQVPSTEPSRALPGPPSRNCRPESSSILTDAGAASVTPASVYCFY